MEKIRNHKTVNKSEEIKLICDVQPSVYTAKLILNKFYFNMRYLIKHKIKFMTRSNTAQLEGTLTSTISLGAVTIISV